MSLRHDNSPPPRETAHDIRARFGIAADKPAPTPEKLEAQRDVAARITATGVYINDVIADSPDKSNALRKLEEALMWAGKAIYK